MRNLHMMWFICLYQKDITKVSKVAVAMDASVLSFTLNCPAVGLESSLVLRLGEAEDYDGWLK